VSFLSRLLGMTKGKGSGSIESGLLDAVAFHLNRMSQGPSPTQGVQKRLGSVTTLYRTAALSFLSSRAKPRDLQFRGPFLETPDPTPPQTYLEPSTSSAIASNLLTVFQFRPVDAHCSVFSILTREIFG
jgi:hypothetical protein